MNARLVGFMIAGFLASEICIRLFGIDVFLVLVLAVFVYAHLRNRRTL